MLPPPRCGNPAATDRLIETWRVFRFHSSPEPADCAHAGGRSARTAQMQVSARGSIRPTLKIYGHPHQNVHAGSRTLVAEATDSATSEPRDDVDLDHVRRHFPRQTTPSMVQGHTPLCADRGVVRSVWCGRAVKRKCACRESNPGHKPRLTRLPCQVKQRGHTRI